VLWNGKDPILKERLFGLTNCEGNHGEDVKEYDFYLDRTAPNTGGRKEEIIMTKTLFILVVAVTLLFSGCGASGPPT
jgi:hypothetical protein